MERLPAGREASSGAGATPYVRHCPERTLLHQLVEEYYPAFKAHLSVQGTTLPNYVEREFEDYLQCGRHEQGLRAVHPGTAPLRGCLRLFQIAPGDLIGVDIRTCPACGGAVRIIACIEDAAVIEKILTHLDLNGGEPEATRRPPRRAPPQGGLFDEAG